MRKIIDGKLFDTTTAHEVGCKSYGDGPRDFRHFTETLYRKRTGEFFLHGEGGPLSQYREYISDNQWRGGERIMPLSVEVARKWAEENLGADEYEAAFGPVREDGGRVVLSVSLDAATADRIRQEAAEKGMSVSALIASKF